MSVFLFLVAVNSELERGDNSVHPPESGSTVRSYRNLERFNWKISFELFATTLFTKCFSLQFFAWLLYTGTIRKCLIAAQEDCGLICNNLLFTVATNSLRSYFLQLSLTVNASEITNIISTIEPHIWQIGFISSNRSQITSRYGKNTKLAQRSGQCVTDVAKSCYAFVLQ